MHSWWILLMMACSPRVEPVMPDPDSPRFVALDEAVVRAGPGPAHTGHFTLGAGAIGTTVAVATAWSGEREPITGLGYRYAMVHTDRGQGWVDGEHVAIEVDHGAPHWPGRTFVRRQVGDVQLWSALRRGREWSGKNDAWDRPVVHGHLVLERPGGIETIGIVSSDGWGSRTTLERVVWRDLTGDGRDDAIMVFSESTTEVGHAGRSVVFYDVTRAPLEPLVALPVHDPTRTGLTIQDRFGWVDVFVDDKRMHRTTAVFEPCDGGRAWTPACPRIERSTWRWDTGTVARDETETRRLTARVAAGPLYPRPEAAGGPKTVPPREVCVDRTHGPVGASWPFWARVRPCDAEEPLGWVPSDRLAFPDLLDEILGPRPDDPARYVRFDWDRQ